MTSSAPSTSRSRSRRPARTRATIPDREPRENLPRRDGAEPIYLFRLVLTILRRQLRLLRCLSLFVAASAACKSDPPGSNGGSQGGGGTSGASLTGGSSAGSAGGSGAIAGASGAGGTSGASGSGGDPCASAIFCDDFEHPALAAAPIAPWAPQLGGSATAVVDGMHRVSGEKSVKFAIPSGPGRAYIALRNAPVFPIATNAFFGRAMFWLEAAPTASVHWTIGHIGVPAVGLV